MFLRCDTARLSKQRFLKQARVASCQHTEGSMVSKGDKAHLQHHAHSTTHDHAISRKHPANVQMT